MANLKELSIWDLINELKSRGVITDLLWNRDDVIMNLERINEDREDHEKLRDLDEMEMDDILESLTFGYYIERINEEISDAILEYLE
jgi:hypothetical protein